MIYDLQFFLRQKFNLTENIRLNLDDGYIGRGIFVHSKKAFDTVDHKILLPKLDHYGI